MPVRNDLKEVISLWNGKKIYIKCKMVSSVYDKDANHPY